MNVARVIPDVYPAEMSQRYRKIKINGKTRQLSRHLMEQKLGRALDRFEYVHHQNHDKLDDRVDNYELTTPKAHAQHHNQKHALTKVCAVCTVEFTPAPTKRARQVTCSRACFKKHASSSAKKQMADRPAPSAKLTSDQVREIRARFSAGGETMRAIGRELGIHHGQVSAIVNRRAWKWVSP